jgi:hypothetical protein
MESKTQTGYLVLADISGYTSYLANTEIEHANIAISRLLEPIIEKLGSALTIAKLEGDAVFAYQGERKLQDGGFLLALIDQTYFTFREQAHALYSGTTCPCKACRAIPTLDLKFIVHQGDFILQQIAGIRDILGSDVNLVHRLLKNRVAESTSWRGYALFTLPAMETIQADKTGFIQQSESYEHLGEVLTYVLDLHPRYESIKGY